jgi:hypothetical protein
LSWAAVLGRPRLAARLAPLSRDVRALTTLGLRTRLEEVLEAEPELVDHRLANDEAPTPLFCLPDDDAVATGIAEVLVRRGADPAARNEAGLTAAAYALQRGLDEAADTIERGRR